MLGLGNNLILNNASKSDGNVPINVVAPVISGTALVGNTLTSTTGTWTSDTGVTGYLYQWTRNGVNISGATNSTYTLVSADLNTSIICKVAATDTDGTSAYVNSNSLVVYDSDYKAVLDYATTQGYTLPSVSQRLKQSILLSSLKTAGIWSKLDTLRVYATDGSESFALIDWKRLSLCTAINSPNFTTNQGYQGNGTSSYIDTGFNPNTAVGANNYKLTNASIGAWVFAIGNGAAICGADTGIALSIRNSNSGQHRINSGNILTAVDLSGTGLRVANKTAPNTWTFFRNLTAINGTGGLDNNVTTNITDLKAISTIFGNMRVSISYAGASLVAENTSLYNAFDTYMTSL